MVWHSSLADLQEGLSALGEVPEFVERGPGHLQHRCKHFSAVVNFWPSKSSCNVQGDDHLERHLRKDRLNTSRLPGPPVVVALGAQAAAVASGRLADAAGGGAQKRKILDCGAVHASSRHRQWGAPDISIGGVSQVGLPRGTPIAADLQPPSAGHGLKESLASSVQPSQPSAHKQEVCVGGVSQVGLPRGDGHSSSSPSTASLQPLSAGHMLKESQVSSADPSQPPVNKAIIVMIDKPSQEVCVPVELCAPGEQPLLQSKADEAKAAEAALDALRVVVSQSFDQWRGQRRRVMGEAYKDFCSARDLICHDNFAAVRSVANVWALPLDLQTAIATWCTNEQRGLEPSFEQWEQEETRALDKAFAAWTEEHRCAVAGERARILQELRSQARSELEAWKGQERAALLQDAGRATAAADSDKEIFRQELCKQMQLLRSADARAAAAETECEELRKRAQRAEAALRAERVASVARAQTRPVFQSVRGERLTKRVRVEHHPCLQGYVGDLCTKINRALEDGKITQRQAHKCHEIRMEGNRAAHERQGCFGTQVGPGEQDPLSEPTDPGAWDPGSDYGGEYGEESDCDSCDSCDSRFGV